MSVEVTVDPGRLLRMVRARGGIAHRVMTTRTRRIANIAAAEAPGRMGDYVDWEVRQGPRGLQGVVRCDHPAVHYVLRGTRPHLIRPRRARALRFQADGQTVFSQLVRHPGTRPNPFLQRALRMGR
ncbi:hypothetical protein H114_32814 [Streptomyces gancidicus BKS 13-15]|uniref:HK97 gp10 family phage protein n=1 Tax=Streptomyces gancidicus BKS 13-15 TaxID=1284664 RepID=M3B9L5_STREZ|nr:hypothetical protein [Streptomyces gancidicus]EMF20424.1 hypothetical protein H114_32814 [Streptomyces gancidicus BKS 13-15]